MLTHSLTESVKMVFLWLTNLEAGDNTMFFFFVARQPASVETVSVARKQC